MPSMIPDFPLMEADFERSRSRAAGSVQAVELKFENATEGAYKIRVLRLLARCPACTVRGFAPLGGAT